MAATEAIREQVAKAREQGPTPEAVELLGKLRDVRNAVVGERATREEAAAQLASQMEELTSDLDEPETPKGDEGGEGGDAPAEQAVEGERVPELVASLDGHGATEVPAREPPGRLEELADLALQRSHDDDRREEREQQERAEDRGDQEAAVGDRARERVAVLEHAHLGGRTDGV